MIRSILYNTSINKGNVNQLNPAFTSSVLVLLMNNQNLQKFMQFKDQCKQSISKLLENSETRI